MKFIYLTLFLFPFLSIAHARYVGPDVPHVGWQTPGKRNSGGGERGHILLDEVPTGRSATKE